MWRKGRNFWKMMRTFCFSKVRYCLRRVLWIQKPLCFLILKSGIQGLLKWTTSRRNPGLAYPISLVTRWAGGWYWLYCCVQRALCALLPADYRLQRPLPQAGPTTHHLGESQVRSWLQKTKKTEKLQLAKKWNLGKLKNSYKKPNSACRGPPPLH